MLMIMTIISMVSGLGLITTIALQTSKAESFSGAMGGADTSQFRKGTRDELLARFTKYLAIIWIVSITIGTILWYKAH